jgi:hypothetical protein
MKQYKFRDLSSVFENKLQMKLKETDHANYSLFVDKKLVVRTKLSHKKGEVGNVQNAIRRQLKLNEKDFMDLINCPLSKEGYIEILRNKGIL